MVISLVLHRREWVGWLAGGMNSCKMGYGSIISHFPFTPVIRFSIG